MRYVEKRCWNRHCSLSGGQEAAKVASTSSMSPYSILMSLMMLLIAASGCLAAEKPERRLMPYNEADVHASEYTKMVWISPTKVVFSAEKIGWKFSEFHVVKGDFVHEYLSKRYEVAIFDSETGKTTQHHDGSFVEYKDDIITIGLEVVERKDGWPTPKDKTGAYGVSLKGPIGQEKEIIQYFQNSSPQKNVTGKCSNNPQDPPIIKGTYIHNYPLNSDHGCIEERPLDSNSRTYSYKYFRNDGNVIELDTNNLRIHMGGWYPWLGAYFLVEEFVGDAIVDKKITKRPMTAWLMQPDGRLSSFSFNESVFLGAMPTRAGLIVMHGDMDNKYEGFRIHHGKEILQITKGRVVSARVSPDGCRVAYVYEAPFDRTARTQERKLRVIDVCKGLSVSSLANPFK